MAPLKSALFIILLFALACKKEKTSDPEVPGTASFPVIYKKLKTESVVFTSLTYTSIVFSTYTYDTNGLLNNIVRRDSSSDVTSALNYTLYYFYTASKSYSREAIVYPNITASTEFTFDNAGKIKYRTKNSFNDSTVFIHTGNHTVRKPLAPLAYYDIVYYNSGDIDSVISYNSNVEISRSKYHYSPKKDLSHAYLNPSLPLPSMGKEISSITVGDNLSYFSKNHNYSYDNEGYVTSFTVTETPVNLNITVTNYSYY